jgi:serine protease Do
MLSRIIFLSLLVLAAVLGTLTGSAQPPTGKHPWYIDDTKFLNNLVERLTKLAASGKCLSPERIAKKIARDRTCTVALAKPGNTQLTPEEIYKHALPSVFAIGCVLKPEQPDENYEIGWFASAWALAADGILVTNWHVFEDADRACFGVANHKGEIFPVIDILGVNKKADVAIVKVAGSEFTPLPLATEPAEVGSWVGVLSHPGHQWFTFTQGHVTRYTKNFGGAPENQGERWMSITADFAGGSSGGPVLNRFGAVVGMACVTSNIDFDGEEPPQDGPKVPQLPDKPRPDDLPKKPDEKVLTPPEVPESRVQMIVKLTVPAAEIRKVIEQQR